MKKTIPTFLGALMITLVSVAQSNSISPSADEMTDPLVKKSFSGSALARIKAEEGFLKSNKQVEKIQWFQEPTGFLVYYEKNGNKGRSFYDKKGRFVYNIVSYKEQFLPREVRMQVKSVYYMDYMITNVTEINQATEPNKTIYLIQITDNKIWKKLRIADGEMEVVEEFPVR